MRDRLFSCFFCCFLKIDIKIIKNSVLTLLKFDKNLKKNTSKTQ